MGEYVWVAHAGEDILSILQIDPFLEVDTLDITAQTGLKALGARRLAFDPKYGRLLVSCTYANCVGVIDVKEKKWVQTVYVGAAPTDICICDDTIVVCCAESESLWSIDRNSLNACGCMKLSGFPYSMNYSNQTILLCCMGLSSIISLDEQLNITNEYKLSNRPMHAIKLLNSKLVCSLLPNGDEQNGFLALLDDSDGKILEKIKMDTMPLAISVADKTIMAVDVSSSKLYIVDKKSFIVREKCNICSMPDDLLLMPNGDGVMISCMIDAKIMWIDYDGNVKDCIRTRKEPRGLAYCRTI